MFLNSVLAENDNFFLSQTMQLKTHVNSNDETLSPEKFQHYEGVIRQQTKQSATILNELLTVTQKQA